MSSTTNSKIFYIAQLCSIAILFILFARWTLSWPFVYHIVWPVFFALYSFVSPFRKLFSKAHFYIYCKLVYENETFWELFYDFCATILPKKVMGTINYGYASLENGGKTIELAKEDEHDRMSLQLFHRTLTGGGILSSFKGKTILEVSSGRAAGLNWIAKAYPSSECLGIDLSSRSVSLA